MEVPSNCCGFGIGGRPGILALEASGTGLAHFGHKKPSGGNANFGGAGLEHSRAGVFRWREYIDTCRERTCCGGVATYTCGFNGDTVVSRTRIDYPGPRRA